MTTSHELHKPAIADAPEIAALIKAFSAKGVLLPRSLNDIYDRLRDFVVAKQGGRLIGCAALRIFWGGLGEVRSLAVAEDAQHVGAGRALVDFCLREAIELGIKEVFALTYVTSFFAKFGFREYPKEKLPQKVWTDCVNCPKFPNCDETAMFFDLSRATIRKRDRKITSG